ncbi:T9SS type A sorting domain-containing protein [Bacteroidota bacterium]
MKNLHFFIIVFLFLFFSNNSYGQNDYLKSSTNTGTATTSGTAYSNVAATTINLNGDITKVMVVAGMNMKGSGTSLLSRLSWYNIINSSNADLSGEISRLVDKTDDDDYGIGSLVHIFDVTGISGNVTYTLQHKNTTAAAERNVETTAYITAIAFQRRLSNNTDIGSGGFVGLAEDLEQNASITVTMKHSIDDILNQEGATDETLTTSAVILTGFQTYDQSFYTWDGSSSTAWATADNWANGVAPTTTSHDVTIPDVSTNDPIISSARSCNTVFIRSGGSLTISAALTNNGTFTVESNASESGSLILSGSGSVSGDITYQRYMTGVDKWHLISSPVVGQDIGDFITASGNSIATKGTSPVYYAMSDYNEAGDVWNGFFESTVGGNFTDGKGYEALRSASGNISFTGTVRTTDVTGISITRAGEGWNLLGNPYPSAINANSNAGGTNFLTTNSASLDPSFAGVYFWNAATSAYVAITNASAADYVPPGQGFFVRAKDNSSQTVGITEGMQSHQTDADFKSANTPWPSINLIAESEDATSSTYITFNSSMTRGLDITYDAGVFRANPDFSLYSRLVEDNGINFTIQCLPEEYDDLVIPIGLDAPEGLNVTFRAEVSNLPDDCTCYLENRDAGTYTQLKAAGSSYDIEINRANVGVGAFFLHTSFKTLGIDNRKLSEDSYKIIVNQAEGYIRIVGDMNPNSIARVYDLAGRLKKEIQLPNAKDNRLTLTNLKRGIYILQIMNKNEVIGRKISW